MFFIKCIFTILAMASLDKLPAEPFSTQYEKADRIIMGEVVGVDDAKIDVPALKEFKKKWIKKARVKVLKTWKGKSEENVEFYYASPLRISKDPELQTMTGGPLMKGWFAILFLRGDQIQIARHKTGIARASDQKYLESSPLYKALEAIASGRSVEEAAKIIDK